MKKSRDSLSISLLKESKKSGDFLKRVVSPINLQTFSTKGSLRRRLSEALLKISDELIGYTRTCKVI
ncbi:MAG: hypothetical protein Metus_0108 [Candidatus Methanosuratincola subterraneus]|uniref:Uncharacterized protein n=1 Tax=Methanosuratincola subterraneus TaxID=2593994 RepID=A0A444L932_METS7|nr:MAG: hypothetical protein Metus_0108 [Candidatus Methanosuratincola subterraneus]